MRPSKTCQIFASFLWVLSVGTACKGGGDTTSATNEAVTANNPAASVSPTILAWPDSGLNSCYDTTTTIACTGNGGTFPRQDADFANQPAARSYSGPTQHGTYTSDYTTADNTTGLRWKTCSEGLTGSSCSTGTMSNVDWSTATGFCSSLNTANSGAGYAGVKIWRLPTKPELATLLDSGPTSSPAINSTAFPATAAAVYWTSSTYKSTSNQVWMTNFTDGYSGNYTKTSNARVRCVATISEPANVGFTDLNDGTIKDTKTNLIWQKCVRGLSGTGCATGTATGDTWANSLTYCNTLSLASRNWRLPSITEFHSIIDPTMQDPAFSSTAFPNTPTTNAFATSTSYSIGSAMNAWSVTPGDGGVSGSAKLNATHWIRCVATGP